MLHDPDRLWKCDNDYDTETTYKKGTAVQAKANQGVCAGQSALWCHNMVSGVRDIFSKPELMRAMVLQRLYDWSSDRGQLCEKVGMTVVKTKKFGTYNSACLYMETNPGTYYITLFGHGVAGQVGGGFYYGFEPNFGLYRYSKSGELIKFFRKSRKAVGIDGKDGMEVFQVQLAPS